MSATQRQARYRERLDPALAVGGSVATTAGGGSSEIGVVVGSGR